MLDPEAMEPRHQPTQADLRSETDGERPREVRPQKIRGRLRQAGEGVLHGPAVAAPGIGQDQSARRPSQQMHAQLAFQRSEEHTSELQSLMRNSYAVSCLKTKNKQQNTTTHKS